MPGIESFPNLSDDKKLPQPSDKLTATALKLGLETAAQIYFSACRSAAAGFTALQKVRKKPSNRPKN